VTVNALHVKGPSIDIVVASAHSDITCPWRPSSRHRLKIVA